MEIGHVLLVVAAILEIFDLVLGGRFSTPERPGRRWWLTPVAVLLVIIALAVGAPPLIAD